MLLLLADIILVVHFLFIIFVVLGQASIIVGYFNDWSWVRNLIFRIAHLFSIGLVVVQAWAGQFCPLTLWESELREAVGAHPYTGTFVQHWVGRIIYYDGPQWIFTAIYTLFGTIVLISWIFVRPLRKQL